ncbi:MAG: 4-hydroxy-tetrahydrodipicolinate synthase [Rhodospirillaceae bacterium]|jgi:4-hydroxy-tetrahydrodipicolinate synthase|nr:4-hydroxy-tetrahydrodipicolinate synthase [Rhodospirillaceae bacterium]MBT6205905.1 4-hydroxy-tetrahydrodipicolinate synthase [Rhodospirillaceae bacterium]MBT6512126.1 4-hydroxy-tetrahydrodipicolinate synthase [Rhodospirillaceae bacterium]
MTASRLKGSFVALITLLRDGKVDEKGYQDFVNWQIAEGTHGLVPMGTTGESPTMSHDEDMRVVRLCIEAAAGRVPVVAGTGSNSTDECIMLTKSAQDAGADAALIVTGYYNKPTQEGLYQHFKAVNDAVDIPIIVYNIPGRTGVDIAPPTMKRIAALGNVVGCKESTAEADRVSKQRYYCGPDFVQMSGEDAAILGLLGMGGHGCISVTANLAPALCSQMHVAWQKGDFETARDIQNRLMPLHEAMFSETSPGPVKHGASLMGWGDGTVRLPLVSPTAATCEKVEQAMRSVGLIN